MAVSIGNVQRMIIYCNAPLIQTASCKSQSVKVIRSIRDKIIVCIGYQACLEHASIRQNGYQSLQWSET